MTDKNFIPAADPAALGRCYSDASKAARTLLVMLMDHLSPDRTAELEELINGGGRVGLEILIDRHGQDSINFIGIECEGARLVLSTVTPPAPAAAKH